ncbi:MAG: hypothetical protein NC394_01435 [Bacteroides sp.]|nr:hypothetical protein [Bacteroides sp.]
MWIMGFDGKSLCDAKYFTVTKNVGGGKDKKYAIVAFSQTTASVTLTGVACAYFSEEDKAIAALERVSDYLEANPGKVYRFDKLCK